MKVVTIFYAIYIGLLWVGIVLAGFLMFSGETMFVIPLIAIISSGVAIWANKLLIKNLEQVNLSELGTPVPVRVIINIMWIFLGFIMTITIYVGCNWFSRIDDEIYVLTGIINAAIGWTLFFVLRNGLKWFGVLNRRERKKSNKPGNRVWVWLWKIFWGIRFRNKGYKRLFICGFVITFIISLVLIVEYAGVYSWSWGDIGMCFVVGLLMCVPYILIIRLISWVVSGFSITDTINNK